MPPPKYGLETLNVRVLTVVGFVVTIIGTATTFGVAWNRLAVLETRAAEGDRIRAERIAQIERMQLELALLRAEMQALREARSADGQQLGQLKEKHEKLQTVVLVMCRAGGNRGYTCDLR